MKNLLQVLTIILVLFLIIFVGWIFMTTGRSGAYTRNENVISTIDRQVKKDVKIIVVGDMMFGRNVETLSRKETTYPFERIADLFFESDGAIGNLEGPIAESHTQTPNNGFDFSFPAYIATLLKDHRFLAVSLANNHTTDRGESDFINTTKLLQENGIAYFGHPVKIGTISSTLIPVGECEIELIGFNTTYPSFSRDSAISLIKETKKTLSEKQTTNCKQNRIIVYIHWGDEYVLHSNARQQELAHELIDAGASLIIGAHPHVVQEIEKYHDALIFYSLGNFIFDQYFSRDVQEGLALQISVNQNTGAIDTISLLQIKSEKSQPYLPDESEHFIFLQTLAKRSSQKIQEEITGGVIHLTQ